MGALVTLISTPLYPALREAANRASAIAQRRFMTLNRVQLGLLCASAFTSGLSFGDTADQKASNWTVCVFMFLSLAVTTALRLGKFDDRWFKCRAFAENFKSAVWRFVMSPREADDAEQKYLAELEHLRERLPDLQSEFLRLHGTGSRVTDWMRDAHALDLPEKIKLYRKLRVDDQISWYSAKSASNQTLETRWFWAIFCVEFLAIIFAAFQAKELLHVNPVAGVAAFGTVMIAWTQIKRFSDLATSYAIAQGDLQGISDANLNVTDQNEANSLVDAVEQAVSREHSMWLARRTTHC